MLRYSVEQNNLSAVTGGLFDHGIAHRRVGHRIDSCAEKRSTGKSVEGTALMLGDDIGSQPKGKIGATCSMCRDEQTKRRKTMVSTPYHGGESSARPDHSLGTPDFSFQLGSQLSDNPVNTSAVPAACVGMRQGKPRINKWRVQSLGCDEQFRVKRYVGILLVNLPEDGRSRRPNPRGGTPTVPFTAPQREGLLDPSSKAFNAFLRWQHCV